MMVFDIFIIVNGLKLDNSRILAVGTVSRIVLNKFASPNDAETLCYNCIFGSHGGKHSPPGAKVTKARGPPLCRPGDPLSHIIICQMMII